MSTIDARLDEAPAPDRQAPRFVAGFHPDIEGLRALAVLTVLAFHAAVPHLAGGFVGVDVFFVISGYLITSLMLVELAETGTISLREFYARRGRRILPSAGIVIVAIGIASWFLLPMLGVRNVAQDMVAAALFIVNWHFIAQGTDYLAASSDHSPLLHFWSLAVEEQFYFVWPAALLLAVSVARRFGRSWVAAIGVVVAATAVGSFALSLLCTLGSPPFAYLSSPTRAWQFAAGAAIALAAPALRRLAEGRGAAPVLLLLGWAGLLSVLASAVLFDESTPYPGTAALLPTLGTTAMIVAGILGRPAPGSASSLLATSPMRAIGRLSFAWYLWHWPFVVFGQQILGADAGWPVLVLLVLASAVPAWLSLRFLERPIRFAPGIASRASAGLAVGAISTMVALAAGLFVGTQSLLALGSVDTLAQAATISSVFGDAGEAARTSGGVSPTPLKARDDRPKPDECLTQRGDAALADCSFGNESGPTVVLFGDSHAQQWQPAFEALADQRGWNLVMLTKAGCPPQDIAPRQDDGNFSQPDCPQWREAALARITVDVKPELVVVAGLGHYIPDSKEMQAAWNRTLDRLRVAGAPIAYIRDTPDPGHMDVPVCMSGALDDWRACAFTRESALRRDPVQVQSMTGDQAGVSILDFTSYLCPEAMCPAARGGTLFYRDDSHITATLARVLTPAVAQQLDAAGIAPATSTRD
jgi:peptidoglycan/LPS O-acetylase OafA/YrhL